VKKYGCLSVVAGVLLCFSVAAAQVKAGGPNGTQSGPLKLFLLYPHYRGYLFDDWSQSVGVDVSVAPPIGKAPITTYLPVSGSDCAVADFTAQTQALKSHGMVDFPALSSTYAGDPYFPYDLQAQRD